jgi:hypothetical protein
MIGPNRRGKRCGSSEGKREPLSLSNTDLDSGARAGIELTLKTGKELRRFRPGDYRLRIRGSRSMGQGRLAQPGSSCVKLSLERICA